MTEQDRPNTGYVPLDVEIREAAQMDLLIHEATQSVEQELAIEDKDWIRLGGPTSSELSTEDRTKAVKPSRLYYMKDPLGRQAIRLWTDYTFGTGMTFKAPDTGAQTILDAYWHSRENRAILGDKGQRTSSDKLLVDGEIFFALFRGPNRQVKVRLIDPLEITEIISDPDDVMDVRYYKREWINAQGKGKVAYYRSLSNIKNVATLDRGGNSIQKTEDALVYHLAINTIGQRGNPLLLPAIDWIKQYRRFLASRVAIMLALTRFAWKTKVQGGAAAVATAKANLQDKTPEAGATILENMGSDTTPIRADTGASGAREDLRALLLQVSASTGIPMHYFGDVSTGNWATAKTLELPMLKMFQSHQQVWKDAYRDLDDMVLEHGGIGPNDRYVDRDFAAIAPEDAVELAKSIAVIIQAFPNFADSTDVKQVALLSIGVDDVDKVIKGMEESAKDPHSNAVLIRELRKYTKEIQRVNGNGDL